jgi:hypothetical protein
MAQEPPSAEQQRRHFAVPGIDPRNLDPRKAIDPAVIEKMVRAQVAARVQAQQATTVFLATVVSLITSAFGFAAALAWNGVIQIFISRYVGSGSQNSLKVQFVYALAVTLVGVAVILVLNRVGRRLSRKSVLEANAS